jgi:hypothetical protein
VHLPGFHVEWKKSNKARTITEVETTSTADFAVSNADSNAVYQQLVHETEEPITLLVEQKNSVEMISSLDIYAQEEQSYNKIKPVVKRSTFSSTKANAKKVKVEPLVIASIACAVLIPIMCALAVIGTGTGSIWIIAALFALLAIVFGILAKIKIKKSKTSQQDVSASQSGATRKIEPFSLTSTLLVALVLLFALIAFLGSGTGIFLLFAIVLSILAMVFGLIGLIRFKKRPGQYKGKTLAIIGFYLGTALAFILLILPGLFSSGSSFLDTYLTISI